MYDASYAAGERHGRRLVVKLSARGGRPSKKVRDDALTFGKERHMFALLKKLIAKDAGQDLAEYGIALAVIGALAAGAAVAIAGDVNKLWSTAQKVIDSAATAV